MSLSLRRYNIYHRKATHNYTDIVVRKLEDRGTVARMTMTINFNVMRLFNKQFLSNAGLSAGQTYER